MACEAAASHERRLPLTRAVPTDVSSHRRVDGLPLNVPYGTFAIDGRGTNAAGVSVIPIEGGERAVAIAFVVVIELSLNNLTLAGVVLLHQSGWDAPDAKVVGEDGEQVKVNGVLVPNEHGFGGQEGVVESEHMEDVVGELVVDYLA
uniref:Uncharacterized protein n=1 Tax=Oryza meridionalis TaxID=40149 RepID=A0A0E0C335_9ORYZ